MLIKQRAKEAPFVAYDELQFGRFLHQAHALRIACGFLTVSRVVGKVCEAKKVIRDVIGPFSRQEGSVMLATQTGPDKSIIHAWLYRHEAAPR